ncbi:hypothetical protein FT663_03693 [Candidozyma haemuli var. vulneris]|uniref:Uncharacterized protein n=1 Tax=Candidozyma haemuli TaxID=45357 RepID=A0A2V1ASJ8_9ASCO|nr:hypothetical protein CXQ85_004272 [[Candida] haemuloni]KAF3987694.1 hypothetical protein FT662_03829 [[Candida] haemuloni var. vulneris]KAF3989233.1 hypothetical protein FT663_03693 [[Candida] haemuloni var. vulneris]PVH20765.1 hypothetical protein CXQ85_004272 [[Candida] haemuloni]
MSKTQNPIHNLPDDDAPPDLPPPSYNEAISSPATGSSDMPPVQPQRPPQPPQRPASSSNGSYRPAPPPQRAEPGMSYSNNESLPFQFPKRYFCKKCKNTGYRKDHKMCLDCWNKLYIPTNAYNPNPHLPFKYPKGFLCEKCYNTGKKDKNGKPCKDCYRRFAKRNNYSINPPGLSGPYMAPPQPMMMPGPPMMPGSYGPGPQMPMRVQPGDPRLGGTLCGNCRGTGQTWFLLDSDLCTVCGGLGRLLNRY